jgi:hypothetical protein
MQHHSVMKKSTRRLLKKSARTVRKQFKQMAGPMGGGDAALMLGAVIAAGALHPEVRARTKDLALAALDRLQAMISDGADITAKRAERALESAHH